MPTLNLKPTHKSIAAYYESLNAFERLGVAHETAVRSAFQSLLETCGKPFRWTLVPEHSIALPQNRRIRVDGALIDEFNLPHGYWEAKDTDDDLPAEVERKFAAGYPSDNILFQTPQRAILWQNDAPVLDADLTDPAQLVQTLEAFFSHRPPAIAEWDEAVGQFKDKVPDIGRGLAALIQRERENTINPNLSEAAVEEMLVQHLLTERIFRTVFSNPDFTRRNVIAHEIEKVIDALTSQSFNRRDFLDSLNRFYVAIERTAATIDDFSQKQHFLNTVYEQFFQGFSVAVADTHGIVYTPQPIVDFMARSVEQILQTEFGRSLSDAGVHIIDPFVGTGNFIVRMMREIRRTALEDKYSSELHCNEVMLLPYYIASMNIEHEFYETTGRYQPYEGLCLVDTFELAEDHQLGLFTEENTARVKRQKKTEMFVIVGNPPYNAGQVNENDNNKNRKYETMDKRVAETYAKDSKATLKRYLQDPYVKAIRWASDRIDDEGVVALVTNNGFLDGMAFDGMRKHLADDFDAIYILDLSGNVRKNPKLSGTTHNVFGIQVGVSINFFVKKKDSADSPAKIFYARVDEFWRKEEKYRYLGSKGHYRNVEWKPITPDRQHTWLTEGLHAEFDTFVPIGSKKSKAGKGEAVDVIFKLYSPGVNTARDAWAYNFNRNALAENMERMTDTYNEQVLKWERRANRDANVDDFVISDDKKIKWSRDLKAKLKRRRMAEYADHKVRTSLYRPFTESNLYFDRMMNDVVSVFPSIFPKQKAETENWVIIVPSAGGRADYWCFCTDIIPCLTLTSIDGAQCFPFYTYDEDGSNRRENITDWALAQFRSHYQDDTIDKWAIFHYIYALLHHPEYRTRYQANLKRDLPRLPFVGQPQGVVPTAGDTSVPTTADTPVPTTADTPVPTTADTPVPTAADTQGQGQPQGVVPTTVDTSVPMTADAPIPNAETDNAAFWTFAKAGARLAEIHVGYEAQPEYRLNFIENSDMPLDWRVEKMRLSKDKTRLQYNDFLTLDGIPPETYDYQLGNRSALEWVIDQYRIKTDKRSGIVNDPNRSDEPRYIVKLIGKVIAVSLETVEIVKGLPELGEFAQESVT